MLLGVVGVGHVGVFVSEYAGPDELTGLVVRLEQQAANDALYLGLAVLLPLVEQHPDLLHLAAFDLHAKHCSVHGSPPALLYGVNNVVSSGRWLSF